MAASNQVDRGRSGTGRENAKKPLVSKAGNQESTGVRQTVVASTHNPPCSSSSAHRIRSDTAAGVSPSASRTGPSKSADRCAAIEL